MEGLKEKKMMDYNSGYTAAHVHEAVVSARKRGLPGKLAWAALVFVLIGTAIWTKRTIGVGVVANVVAMGFIYGIVLHVVSRVVFLIISAVTLPAYRLYHKYDSRTHYDGCYKQQSYGSGSGAGNSRSSSSAERGESGAKYEQRGTQENGCNQQDYNSRYEDEDYSYTGDRSDDASRNVAGLMTLDDARRIFNLTGGCYSKEELKHIWRQKIKSEKLHPDEGGDPEEFKKIQQAYDVLNESNMG